VGSTDDRADAARRLPLVEETASVIRERIYARRYPAGTWLRQQQLSTELGVSRTPLREAFRLLEQEGLVTVTAGQGARVVSGDLDTLLDAYALRAVVDGLAARLLAENAGRDDLARHVRSLRRTIDVQRATLDPWRAREYTASNVDFHEEIVHLSGNEFVVGQLPILRMTAQVFAPVALVEPGSARRAIAEHTAITDAIEAGDSAEAERLARAHIEATTAELRSRTTRTRKTRDAAEGTETSATKE